VVRVRDGSLTQSFRHVKYGARTWVLDEKTLKPTVERETAQWPGELLILEDHTGLMQINWKRDGGESGDPNAEYVLRWETLPPHRDRPREGVPKPSILRLYRLKYGAG